MIENFEQITKELTADEKKLIPLLIAGFKAHNLYNPIKAPEIVQKLNANLKRKAINEARLRKLTNFIRAKGLLPVIATSKGYYVSYQKETIQSQIRSLTDRAEAIMASVEGLKKWVK